MISFFFIVGTHFFSWGSGLTPAEMRCGKCDTIGGFRQTRGMRFITLFLIIPVVPISGVRHLLQFQTCGTRYQAKSRS